MNDVFAVVSDVNGDEDEDERRRSKVTTKDGRVNAYGSRDEKRVF